jgi:peptide deformylase
VAILPILTGENNPILRKKTPKVERVTKEIKQLIKDMQETMEGKGVGLAAPQVGVSLRLCIATLGGKVTPLLNPQITVRSEEKAMDQEGCLSLPDTWVLVPRSVDIVVRYRDARGTPKEKKLSGFDARVVQHEVDHLDGRLIVDYVTEGKAVAVPKELLPRSETVIE